MAAGRCSVGISARRDVIQWASPDARAGEGQGSTRLASRRRNTALRGRVPPRAPVPARRVRSTAGTSAAAEQAWAAAATAAGCQARRWLSWHPAAASSSRSRSALPPTAGAVYVGFDKLMLRTVQRAAAVVSGSRAAASRPRSMVVLKRVSHLILSGKAIGYSGRVPAADRNIPPTNHACRRAFRAFVLALSAAVSVCDGRCHSQTLGGSRQTVPAEKQEIFMPEC